jgi:hypothetical protein
MTRRNFKAAPNLITHLALLYGDPRQSERSSAQSSLFSFFIGRLAWAIAALMSACS